MFVTKHLHFNMSKKGQRIGFFDCKCVLLVNVHLGLSTNFSIKTLSSPKLFVASLRHALSASWNSLPECTILIPLPPPPKSALIITGYLNGCGQRIKWVWSEIMGVSYPSVSASSRSRWSDWSSPKYPGTTGTEEALIIDLDSLQDQMQPSINIQWYIVNLYFNLFIPIFSIAEGGGPTNSTPSSRQSWAKFLFSERNP